MGRAKTAPGLPRVNLLCHPYAREGQAVVCPLLRGRSPTRWVAPKQHRGCPALASFVTLTRARARQWSARCYGVARQRDGSRQNSIEEQGRLLTNRPCSSLVYEESDSKERLRVSNWIVQRLYNLSLIHISEPTRLGMI